MIEIIDGGGGGVGVYTIHSTYMQTPRSRKQKRYFIIEQQVAQQYSECPSNPHHSMQLK